MSNSPQAFVQTGSVAAPSNKLGLIGLIVSGAGVLTCGVLCPIGAIISLIALFKAPRGLAIAGLVVGFFGSFLLLVLAFLFGMKAYRVSALASLSPEERTTRTNLETAVTRVEDFRKKQNGYPDDLSGAWAVSTLTDGWGRPLVYHHPADGDHYDIRSMGPDGKLNTADDIVYSDSGQSVGTPTPK